MTQLRAALRAGVEDMDTPPTLLSGLRKSYTRQVAARRTGVAVVSVAAAVVGGSMAIAPGAGSPGAGTAARTSTAPAQVRDVAQLTVRITSALNAAEHDVVYVNSSSQITDKIHQVEHIWQLADGSASRDQMFHPNGTPSFDYSISNTGNTISVQYDTRTYRTQAEPWLCTNPAKCGDPSPFTLAGITKLIATGRLTMVGTGEVINGQSTVHLRGQSDAISLTGTLDLWVNTATYLPIHYTVTHASTERDADLTYLPPTKENLALLTAPIPAGFTQQH